MTNYVRKADLSKLKPDDFSGTDLYSGESCTLMLSRVPAGKAAFRRHTHLGDQLYFILTGEMQIDLGDERRTAGPLSLVHIPAGLPHHNWNEGPGDELHFEMIIPSPPPMGALATPSDSPVPAGLRGSVREADLPSVPVDELGMRFLRLADAASGSRRAVLNLIEVTPGGRSPALHVHEFDQFYFVLAGTMNLQIGLEEHRAGPHTLVVLPAGVPHRNWNQGSEPEVHVSLLAPHPAPDSEWDVPVILAVAPEGTL